MAAAGAGETAVIDIHGIALEVRSCGAGRNILFLNSGSWLADESPFVERLAKLGRVVAPVHPGFGKSEAPARLNNVDDLAYVYLDLINKLRLDDVLLVGASFGGWIAAEMAVKTAGQPTAMVLIDPLGIKVGAREERTIADIFATPDAELEAMSYADPKRFHRSVAELDDASLTTRIRSRESLARYGWSPYMHDPKLPSRLHRVVAPTLVLWGEQDRIVRRSCCAAYAEQLPHARFEVVAGAAHLPHVEQQELVLARVAAWARDHGSTSPSAQKESD